MTKETTKKFYTAQAAREYLVGLGFEPFRKGLTCANLVSSAGRKARLGFCLFSRTAQHSLGTGAVWGYTVTMEEA